jgi:hypothetical protein
MAGDFAPPFLFIVHPEMANLPDTCLVLNISALISLPTLLPAA